MTKTRLDSTAVFTFLALFAVPKTECASYADGIALYKNLTTNYNKNVRPKADLSQPTEVEVKLYLKSISGLDEVEGILTTVVSLALSWTDDNLVWIPWHYGNIWEFRMNENSIWIPQFILANPSKKLTQFGIGNSPVTLQPNGRVRYEVADLMTSSCDVDVTYFPFDVQTCIIELMPHGYKSDISVNLGSDAIGLDVFSENNIWILTSTSSENAQFGDNPYAKLSINLKRRYAFFIVNLFSPVVIIAFLNAMVFILPADSGERVGYAITCLLALSVYMTFASESLPVSSKPIAVIIYILLMYIILSTVMCIGVIVSLQLHLHNSEKPPPSLLAKLMCLSCKIRGRSVAVAALDFEKEKPSDTFNEEDKTSVTWKHIANRFDKICFIASVFTMILLATVYLIVVTREK